MNVMSDAWGIARDGQKKFGGCVKEYFKEALKLAWKMLKGERELDIEDEKFNWDYREWKNYGKHRIYIDIDIDLVEYKIVKNNRIGTRRGLVANYYYDVQADKMMIVNYREKDLAYASDEVAEYMRKKVKAKAFEIAEIFKEKENK